MLPAEPRLEVRSSLPKGESSTLPPLLFVHGGFCDSWYWQPYFLPWFASLGYASYALSLRGHGRSGGRESLFLAGLDDFAADVEHVAAQLPEPPVLIGHSMGAAVIERLIATRPLRGAALIAPLPPAGLLVVAARLATEQPDMMHMTQMDPTRLNSDVLGTLKPYYFSTDVDQQLVAEAMRHLCNESPRAMFDLSLRLHWQLPERNTTSMFVLGAKGDRICTPDDVRATADHHKVDAVILDGLAHMMMLERQWQRPAEAIADWLETLH